MQFHDRIRSVLPNDLVLDVGPGSDPFHRADVLLERRFASHAELVCQCGHVEPNYGKKQVVYYNGGRFPFDTNQFDYVVCSHVLEHVPPAEINLFISELKRVAKKGYLEIPSVYYELCCFTDVHKWFVNFRDGEVILLNKDIFTSNWLHKTFRTMWFSGDRYIKKTCTMYPEFYFIGFEWERDIPIRIVGSFDELVNEADCQKWQHYFSAKKPPLRRGYYIKRCWEKIANLIKRAY